MLGELDVLETKIEFLPYSSKYYEEVINVIRQSFFQFETVCIGSEIDKNIEGQKDLEGLCNDALNRRNNVSIVARDVCKDKIVGVSINVLQNKLIACNNKESSYFENFRDTCCKTDNAKSLMNYMIEADARIDIFKKFSINSLLEIPTVLKEYGGQGIGLELCKYSIDIAKNLKLSLVTALWTGKNSQSIGKKLGFDILYEESFNNFSFNGKTFAERVQDSKLTYHVAAKSI
ncbi:hypothetical protein PVAND_009108 [Polypedilum vanderplanki]|uniref:N-acetyltransferase domain-containing protein n=1 Tax=Polypedilum vanderplanki TaxID=319348 RepID=A0A9J6CBP1_POLVA|nr:hypothetical protein PVAND_009108 [Polypedilum vanderplanki]